MSITNLTSRDMGYFFRPLIERSLIEDVGWPDFLVTEYLTTLLIDFSHVDRLYSIKSSLETSGDPLYSPQFPSLKLRESYPFDEEGAFHQHIGDVTLLTVGLFPDNLCQIKHDPWLANHEIIANYMEVGKEAYNRVSHLKADQAPEDAELFAKLSENFVLCAYCLDGICEKFQAQQEKIFQDTRRFFFH
jgi:hypothetical protein